MNWKTLYTESGDSAGYCSYAKFGSIVVINCDYVSISAKKDKKLGTLPTNCRPKKTVLGMAYVRGENNCGQITVDTSGIVKAYCLSTSTGYFGGTVVFPVK